MSHPTGPPRCGLRIAALLLCALLVAACSAAPTEPQVTSPPDDTPTDDTPVTPTEPPDPDPAPEEDASDEPEPTPLPEIPDAVRGVYAHVYSFWGQNWHNLVDLVETTELNAIVVDVKDEAGTLLWPIDHPLTEAGGADWKPEGDPTERLQMLLDADGWPIARISCFKDTLVANARPDLAVQDSETGDTWVARSDFGWLNPYSEEAGQWCIDIGLAAVEAGFKEIQFDYIRFPNGGDGDIDTIHFPGVPDDRPRDQWQHPDAITDFLARATEQIHDAGAYVSADLFGLVTYDFTWNAQGTGQVIEAIAEHVDFISPMVYPSHYGRGNYGLHPHPIEHPYETVWNSMQEAQMRVQDLHAEIRPWLEDFPAPWLGYDHHPDRLRAQLDATYENGIDGWMLWNAANRYSESVLAAELESRANPDFAPPARTADPDAPPGADEERRWPGRPPCERTGPRLQIGEGNLAGSTPPDLAPAADDPAACEAPPDTDPSDADDA